MSRYLIVAHQTATSPELREWIRALLAEQPEATFAVLVPATPADLLPGGRGADAETLAESRAEAAAVMIEAVGGVVERVAVGARQPILAIGDELREHAGYDAIVIGTLPQGISRWLGRDLVSQARRRFPVPVHHVVAEARPRRQMAEDLEPLRGDISTLVERMRDENPLVRGRARQALTEHGRHGAEAVAPLLGDERETVRWEAARTLVNVQHASAIPGLVRALGDASADVRWLAAEALVAHGPQVVVPTLRHLLAHAMNEDLVPGVHHVCKAFAVGEWAEVLNPVVAGLEQGGVSVAWLVPTERALRVLGGASPPVAAG